MQTNNKSKPARTAKPQQQKPKLVFKPYLRGVPASFAAARRALRIWGYTALFTFLYVLVGSALNFDSPLLRLPANAVLLAVAVMMMYADGARHGEGDVGAAEIAQNHVNEGKAVPKKDRELCYHPMKGFFTMFVGVCPLLLVTVVYAFLATKQTYALGTLPSWVTAYERQAEVGQALAYYNDKIPTGLADVLRVITRLVLFPFVNMAGAGNYDAIYLLDKLSPLLCLITPLGYPLGYLRGPALRARVHGSISENIRKQSKRANRERRQRAQQMKRKAEARSRNEKKELI